MFIQNKYTKWYFNIINRHLENPVEGYTERHHIIPKSLGGSNKDKNLVNLTAKAHYICHLLLIRMCLDTKDKAKMVFAIKAMTMVNRHHHRHTSRIFHIFREAHFSQMNGENHPRFGTKLTEEHKKVLREKTREQWKNSNPFENRVYKPWTDEQKAARSHAFKGKCWISNPVTQDTKMVLKSELESYLDDGWIKGRKFSNPFVGSGTNFRQFQT